MKVSRSAATRSGRSQLGLWPVAGYTTTLARDGEGHRDTIGPAALAVA
ncbi:MAG TPA: hypothetical protein VGR06_39185 [Actinophytocola sp.]|nr:hypothetical protein [Actinophytocola sp.]